MPSLRRFLREPLLWFLFVGALIFVFDRLWRGAERDDVIVITASDRQAMADLWEVQAGRPPNPDEAQGMLEDRIREEVLYREAVRLGLDVNDTIIRRRLVQKLTFLTEDLAMGSPPDDATLAGFYAAHADQYLEPERYTFRHVYFAEGTPAAELMAARQALDNGGDPTGLGSPFMLRRQYTERSETEIARQFGTAFAAAVAAFSQSEPSPAAWSPPLSSAFGQHLVQVQAIATAYQPDLAEVRDRVVADFERQAKADANATYLAQVRSRYNIRIDPAPAP